MNTHPVAKPNPVVKLGNVEIGNAKKLSIIAGPCQLESRSHAFDMAGALKEAVGLGSVFQVVGLVLLIVTFLLGRIAVTSDEKTAHAEMLQ